MRLEKTLIFPAKLALLAVIGLIFLAGCATNRNNGQDGPGGQSGQGSAALTQYELIAIDLVNAMVQINELQPANMPDIKITAPKGSFGGALFTVLDSAGYNVRRPEIGLVYADLKWSITPATVQGGKKSKGAAPQTFSIALNNASLSRNYQLGPRKVKPTSNLVLNGVRNTPIKLHDSLFDQVAMPSNKPRSADARRDDANAAMGGSIRNIFDIGGSNYQEQIAAYQNVGTLVVNFPNESAKLSGPARVQLRRFLNSVSRGSDAVWVIGCSIGSTRKEGGNEGLARLRTKAVADWLRGSGMDAERLFAESCWAEDPDGLEMPNRGAQLTLLRERKN